MRAFVAVCDARGFAAAARRLQLSASVITRQVAGLEQRLGVRLLQRTTRSLRLTDAGARFLDRARRILAELEEAEQSAQEERSEPRGRLTIAAPLLFGRMHVASIVARFLETYPQASVDLELSDRNVNLVEDGIDLAVRIGQLGDSGLIARRLGETRRLLVASPGYLERHGPPATPADLIAHQLIAFTGLTPGRTWRFPSGRTGEIEAQVAPRYLVNDGEAAIDYAAQGGGILATLSYQVAPFMRRGELVEVLAEFATPPLPIQAVFPTSRLLSANVRVFLDLAAAAARVWRFP